METLPNSSTKNGSHIEYRTIKDLPQEMLEKVFSYLDFEDLVSVSFVCDHWKKVLNSAPLWNHVQWIIEPSAVYRDVLKIVRNIPVVRNIKVENPVLNYDYDPNLMFKMILEFCTDVRHLATAILYGVKPFFLQKILKKFPLLESLSVKIICNDESCAKFIECLGSCMHLKKLKLSNNEEEIDLKPIADGCPELIHLDIMESFHEIDDLSYLLSQKKHQLKSLRFSTDLFRPDTFIPLRECTNLEYVCVSSTCSNFSIKRILDDITFLPKLRHLGLIHGSNNTEDDLKEFLPAVSSSSLEEIDLILYAGMTEEVSLIIKAHFPMITKLKLVFHYDYDGSGLEHLVQLSHLEYLILYHCPFSESWFNLLLQNKNIQHLDVLYCEGLKDEHALKLLTLPNLRSLDFSLCESLTETFKEGILYCESLKHLDIRCDNFITRDCHEDIIREDNFVMCPSQYAWIHSMFFGTNDD